MAKIYNFYNDAGTINVEVVTDAMLNHETFSVTEIRGLNAAAEQAGFNYKWISYTESAFELFAKTNELNLKVFNDTTLISDISGGLDILTFSFAENFTDAVIDPVAHTISCVVDYGTSLAALVATFTLSSGASAKIGVTTQVSGVTANNFSSSKTYVITSEAGATQSWVVSVRAAYHGTDIATFVLAEQTGAATIDAGAHTVAIEVETGTDVTDLVPTLTVSTGATVSPLSGVTQDFTSPVVYTVTAEDGTEQAWTVTVTVAS